MRAAVCRIDLLVLQSFSLKDRRRVMNSIKQRLRNRFNISIIETSPDNNWSRGSLGIAMVGEDERSLRSSIEKIMGFLDDDDRFDVLDGSFDLF